MLRYRIEVSFVDNDGDEVASMFTSVLGDTLPRIGEQVGPIPTVQGPNEVTGWGGSGTVAFELPREVLKLPEESVVTRVNHSFVFESHPQFGVDPWQTAAQVTLEAPFPGWDTLAEIQALDETPWIVIGLDDDDH